MKIFTVSELTSSIKSLLEPQFQGICVKGEISNFKRQSSGHLYFTLKDASSQISAVLFKGNSASLSLLPKEGDQVMVRGEISLYMPRGQYQMIVRELQFLGQGELLLKLQQLKEQIQSRGWFEASHKKPLPKLPKKIGVITSPTGAVIQDILNVLTRRFSGFHLILYPVKVQGDGAAKEISQAIEDMNRMQLVDVLIVGRGGGSIEDLWAFNEEIVAKAIFESTIPIISAVGHETDFTIADWVADLRAPTPSAAAEIAIAEKANLLATLSRTQQACRYRISQHIQQEKKRLHAISKHPTLSSPYTLLSQPIQQLDAIRSALETLKPSNQVQQWRQRLAPLPFRFASAAQAMLSDKKGKLKAIWDHLCSLNPQNLLQKGYAILFEENSDSTIVSTKDIQTNQTFTVLLHDGKVTATATRVKPNG